MVVAWLSQNRFGFRQSPPIHANGRTIRDDWRGLVDKIFYDQDFEKTMLVSVHTCLLVYMYTCVRLVTSLKLNPILQRPAFKE